MDNRINVNTVCEAANLDFTEVAEALFPENKYPKVALNRVVEGKTALNEVQIRKLARLSGFSISDLFNETWTAKSKSGIVTFTKDSYVVTLDTFTWTSHIKDSLTEFKETIIHDGIVVLSEYFKTLDLVIKNNANAGE